jgi:hypothetical protein
MESFEIRYPGSAALRRDEPHRTSNLPRPTTLPAFMFGNKPEEAAKIGKGWWASGRQCRRATDRSKMS